MTGGPLKLNSDYDFLNLKTILLLGLFFSWKCTKEPADLRPGALITVPVEGFSNF